MNTHINTQNMKMVCYFRSIIAAKSYDTTTSNYTIRFKTTVSVNTTDRSTYDSEHIYQVLVVDGWIDK